MSDPPGNVVALARLIADALESARVPYAIGGALAYNQWAVPRGTTDVDLTVFVGESAWPSI